MHAQDITIELRRGATVVKVAWPLAAASYCAVWLRELLR
jgi:transposase